MYVEVAKVLAHPRPPVRRESSRERRTHASCRIAHRTQQAIATVQSSENQRGESILGGPEELSNEYTTAVVAAFQYS